MIEKIYSRNKIRLPKFKKLNMIVILFVLIIIISIISFIIESYPIFKASCVNVAASKAINIVYNEVQKSICNYKYEDLVEVSKDENGNINLIQVNTLLINKLISEITQNIQNKIDKTSTAIVYINYGSVSGISILKNLGPKFNIELEASGNVEAHMKSKFESSGINQTLHRLYLEIDTEVNILTPLGTFEKKITPEILLTEAVIVGKISEAYYNVDLNK